MSTSIRFSNFVRKALNVSSGGQDGDLCHSLCQHFFSFLSTTFSQNLYETLCNCFLEHFKFKLKFNMLLISILKLLKKSGQLWYYIILMCRKCHVFVMRSAKDLWGGEWTENLWQVKIRKCVDKEEISNWCVGSQ